MSSYAQHSRTTSHVDLGAETAAVAALAGLGNAGLVEQLLPQMPGMESLTQGEQSAASIVEDVRDWLTGEDDEKEETRDLDGVLAELETQSSTIAEGLKRARDEKWVFVYGAAGAGTSTNREATPPPQ